MWKCLNCGYEFEEPSWQWTSYEAYYGVSSLFGNSTSLTLLVCPNCESDDIDEYNEEEEEEEEEE